MKFTHLFLFLFCCIPLKQVYADDTPPKENPIQEKTVKMGNLSLPPSQQPGPLVGLGENVIDKGELQVFIGGDQYRRKKGYFDDVSLSARYGISDTLAALINVPVAVRYKDRDQRSAGLQDVSLGFEYAFYNAQQRYSADQATIIATFLFPTGSMRKSPQTGYGSPSFFIGATYNHTAVDWFYFGALGSVLTTFHGNSKSADVFLYECGFGRNIGSPPGWIIALMMEINGVYASRNFFKGHRDHDSGGNVIFVTPSLYISTETLVFQLGAGGVLTQNLYGNQSRFTHQIIFSLGWSFY